MNDIAIRLRMAVVGSPVFGFATLTFADCKSAADEIDRLHAGNAELVEALKEARHYVITALSHMVAQDSPTRPSGIAAISGDLARIDAALAKAGVG